jgi:hypothetical protein
LTNSFLLQIENVVVGKREKARLKELQKMKKQKIQEILDTQNAAIDADMVCILLRACMCTMVLFAQDCTTMFSFAFDLCCKYVLHSHCSLYFWTEQ